MSEFNRCFGCMRELCESTCCPHCGYDRGGRCASSLHLAPGTVLKGRYVVGKALGQGGFGITYIAWDEVFNRAAAIKEYLPLSLATRNTGSPSVTCASENMKEDYEYGLRKFLDEARILAMFTDMPNIVNVQDFFRTNGTAYMVMEYIEGITFKEYIDRYGGRIPWEQAEAVLSFVADALREVHVHGLLHRDVSPDNIYITASNQIKLLDFGAARIALGAQNKSFSIVLKHGYAPVEQYKSNGRQGPWTDIYALAATYYRSVTGRLPPEALERIEEDALPAPSVIGIKMPPGKERAILKALSVNERERFQSVEEFISALKDQSADCLADVVYAENIPAAPEGLPEWDRPRYSPPPSYGRRVSYIALALGIIILAFIAAYQKSFALFKNGKTFSQQTASIWQQKAEPYSSPVPQSGVKESSAARSPKTAAAPVNNTPTAKSPGVTQVKKKEESNAERAAKVEVEKARRELAEQKKRDADKEAIAREIKIHTGVQLGLKMLNNQ